MSEYLNIANLALGIIGTITGVIALFVSYWAVKKENPRLKIRVLKCEHNVRVSANQVKTLTLWTDFEVKNVGDRGTSIYDAEITFHRNSKQYSFKKQYFEDISTKSVQVNPHETIYLSAQFWGAFEENEMENTEAEFIVYHTHGANSIKVMSCRRKD